jgi:hypothetical protein
MCRKIATDPSMIKELANEQETRNFFIRATMLPGRHFKGLFSVEINLKFCAEALGYIVHGLGDTPTTV